MIKTHDEQFYQLALSFIPLVGPITGKILMNYFGSATQVFKASKKQLLKVPQIGESIANNIVEYKNFKTILEEIDEIQKNGIEVLFFNEPNYPARLKNYDQSPLVLYYKGNVNLNVEFTVGIIGTRSATSYGKQIVAELVRDLSSLNCTIISGLALGVDVAAHKEAITNNLNTIGIMGSGHNYIYPHQHHSIAKKMISQGGLLTEYSFQTLPDRNNFPSRNRLVAALSDVLIVVESGIGGGSLITVEYAHEYKKPVFAIPGPINSKYSKGCNQLIKNGGAMLLESVDDIINYMNWNKGTTTHQNKLFNDLLPNEQEIVDLIIEHQKLHIDQIANMLDVQSHTIAFTLFDLELKSVIKSLPGKQFEINYV